MGRLIARSASACFAAFSWPAPAVANAIDRWAGPIAEASGRFGIPESWIRRVMRAESGGRLMLNGRPIVSHAGAMGLMQLMPGTWRSCVERSDWAQIPHEPRDNILAGAAYLRMMYDRFGYPGLFAAYNAGPARYRQHLCNRPPPSCRDHALCRRIAGAGSAVRPTGQAETVIPAV
jgi:soluble lytic murein transglycosylase-like protein